MIRYVIDASAAVDYLLRTPVGITMASITRGAILIAPELMDVEVLSVLRRLVLRRQIEEQRARLAIEVLQDWPIERIANKTLLSRAWQYRHHISACDAFYLAAARAYDATLLTADGPLTRAPSLDIVIQNIRMG